LFYLYRSERGRLARGMVFSVIKHSPVWLMPLLTANIIDIIAQPAQHAPSELWLNALVLALLLYQNRAGFSAVLCATMMANLYTERKLP
jgi:ATP-binding cassette, subfamily B, bacterial